MIPLDKAHTVHVVSPTSVCNCLLPILTDLWLLSFSTDKFEKNMAGLNAVCVNVLKPFNRWYSERGRQKTINFPALSGSFTMTALHCKGESESTALPALALTLCDRSAHRFTQTFVFLFSTMFMGYYDLQLMITKLF